MKDAWRQPLIELVRQAGAAILSYWRMDIEVATKADATPVTAADMAAHRLLCDGLRALEPAIPVLSEEDCGIPLAERAAWQRWWLVDPLDGTKEFIAGSEEFTVNVALVEHGRVLFGVVGVPVTGRCDVGGSPEPIRVRETSAETFTVLASRRHSSPAQERLLTGLERHFASLRLSAVGSSLKFCLLAEGKADFYPRLAATSQWDTAAAQGVLEGAGGELLDLHGVPLRYPPTEDFLNGPFLALPRAAAWRAEVLQLVREL
ncbi:3'(2'),5'-bisphosphate nucleotidase CysQ [Azotobacter bryophylli]|uniref:3'(2'),5'-bisphosphate nucleotidase CysQ n=1 Tax=Azotobacter bryophylli TaxID=1986537 RepID=A0ABV7AQS5_9GAMM